MNYTGLDTSVVIRLLTGLPNKQAKSAFKFLQETHHAGKQVIVSDLVVAEAYFALHYHYSVPELEAIHQLLDFLTSGFVQSEPKGVAVPALKEASSGKQPGLVDRIIRHQYLSYTREIVTFDVRMSRLENVRRLV